MSASSAVSVHQKDRVLTFVLSKEKYCIEIDKVQEIIAKMRTTPVPKTPSFIEGVMNLRGNIIPVVDMRLKFDMHRTDEMVYAAIIIVKVRTSSIGFIVDSVEEVITLDSSKLAQSPDFGTDIDISFIKSMAQYNDEVIMLLDL